MALFFLLGTMFSGALAQDSKCEEVRYSPSELFQVMAEVEGPRGSLRFPAILDTGATSSLVPASIMAGIGYSSQDKKEGGQNSFDSGTVQSLSFMGVKLADVSVYYVDKRESNNKFAGINLADFLRCHDNPVRCRYEKALSPKTEDESGIIGMSELSQTSFEFKDGVMRVCKGGQ